MVELFRIGHVSIYLFGVTILIGMLVGLWVMTKEGKRKGLDSDKMMDLATYGIISAVVGARLYYVVAFNFSYYLTHPIEIFAINQGGLSIQGGLIAGITFALWYTKRNKLSFWKVADAFAPAIILGQAIGRIGCDVFGIPMKTIYPWGIGVNGQILHPAQLYEMFLDLILFTYLWRSRGKIKYNGELFIKYLVGFSIIRGIVEFFRSNPMVLEPFTIAHVTSLIIIIVALMIGNRIKKKGQIQHQDGGNATTIVGFAEYGYIAILGVVGTWFYYFIH